MIRRIIVSFVLVLLATAGHAQSDLIVPGENLVAEGVPPIPASVAESVGRYTEFRAATYSSWHPTNREMLISTRFGDTNQVHHVKFPGGARTQLTFFPDRTGGAWFPPKGGNFFVFSKDVGGDEFFQEYRYDLGSGDVVLLTDGKSRNTGTLFSHSAEFLAYGTTRRNGKDVDIHIVNPMDPKTDRRFLQLEGGGWFAIDWSPDDKKILLAELISVSESYFWIADVGTGEKTLFTPKNQPQKVSYQGAEFSKDGKGIYLTTDKDSEFQRLAYADLSTKKFDFLTDHIKWDVDSFDLSSDGKSLAFVTNEAGVGRLHILDTKTRKELATPNLPPGRVFGIEWHENGKDLGFTLVSARSSSDAYSYDIKSGKLDRWTYSETGGLNAGNFSEPELIRWKSFDGREITGFLYLPPKKFTGKRPVIINIHGGPESQYQPGFLGRNNYYLQELGVAMIFPNIRGSSGYGKTFLTLDNGMLREDSYKDINALFDLIATRPELDSERIMVTGGSYGGHMTLAIATNYSNRIRAAISVVGPSNLVTFLENTEAYRRDLRRVEYGDERDPKMREFLLRTAPLNNVQKIKKPLFVVQGKNDPRVPASESEQMVAAVRKNGTPVWYLLAKDEGHGFAKKKNADFQFYATVMFIRQQLLN